ncbi:MAG TPA: Xaa-Pro peptidase family protein [Acidimicrobiales bacterium]
MTVDDWAAGATITGLPIPGQPDLARMRADRHLRLQQHLEAQGLDGLVLLSSSSVAYATGADGPGEDSGRAGLFRAVAVVVRGSDAPFLFTPYWDGAPPELPPNHLHGPLFPDLEDGIGELVEALGQLFPAGARLGVDEQTHPMLGALDGYAWSDARDVLGPAKVTKTPDEVSCIRDAQRITELAMDATRDTLRPGVRQTDLSGTFLRRVFELGATANAIDPIWQVMERTRAEGPWTSHGDLAYPTSTTDRILRDGDVIWVDAGISHHGYASDYGRTWLTSSAPSPSDRQVTQFRRWRSVVDAALDAVKPGVTALELGRAAIAANDGVKPWIEHFYLGHGVGTDSAEMPLIGTDLGEAFDESLVMVPGMVVVFEPVIWDEGAAGYRSEDIVAVTDDGWLPLSGTRYDPFEVAR